MKQAVVAIIKNNNGHILSLERYPNDRTNSGWCLPGGKVDEGESLLEAIRRELQEEIGFSGYDHKLVGTYVSNVPNRQTFEVFVYQVKLDVVDIMLNTKELKSYGWFNLQYLPTLAGNTQKAINYAL